MDPMISITDGQETYLTGSPRVASRAAESTSVPPELLALLERQPGSVHRLLVETLRRVDGHGRLDPDLWGDQPDQAQVVERSLTTMLDALELDREVAMQALSVSDVANRVGTDEADVWGRVGRRELLTVRGGEGPRIPEWQLADVPIEAIRSIAEAYPGDAVSLTLWIDRPNDLLGGTTPRQVLARGGVDEVRMAAQAIAS